jgi:hypothetical protein
VGEDHDVAQRQDRIGGALVCSGRFLRHFNSFPSSRFRDKRGSVMVRRLLSLDLEVELHIVDFKPCSRPLRLDVTGRLQEGTQNNIGVLAAQVIADP